MNSDKLYDFVSDVWDRQIVPELTEYIKIPNKSPMFDRDWAEHGYMKEALDLIEHWVRAQPIAGMLVERIQRRQQSGQVAPPVPQQIGRHFIG